jgi:hypothetical protein
MTMSCPLQIFFTLLFVYLSAEMKKYSPALSVFLFSILDNVPDFHYDENHHNKILYRFITSDGGTGPMKSRQPFSFGKTVPIPAEITER